LPDSTIHTEVLPNGLTLLAEPMPSVKSASVSLLVPAGTVRDPADALGSAQMVADWISRGAGPRDSKQLLTDLDNLGASHSESAQIIHSGLSAACLGRLLPPALEILADMVRRPRLDPGEVESLRALAQQELRSIEDDPGSKALIELRRRHFPDPFGRNPAGTLEGVDAVTPESLERFHEAHYRPNEAILSVAGAIDWPSLRDVILRLFDDWQPRPAPELTSHPTGPLRDHIFKDTQQIQIALAIPTVPVTHPDQYKARAASFILGGPASARFFTEIREKRGLCYSVYAGYESLKDQAALICHAGTSTDRAEQTLEQMQVELERLAREGVDAEELDTMRAGLKTSLIMQQESSSSRASMLASDWYFLGRVRPLSEISRALDALTSRSVSDFCATLPLELTTLLTLGVKPLAENTESTGVSESA
jgi:predicted Zn-dependent peptidase